MKAVTWHGRRDVRVEDFPDPRIEEPTDAIVRITSTAICGSDLHLYELMSPFLEEGDVLGHEPMGIVEEVGTVLNHSIETVRRGGTLSLISVDAGSTDPIDMDMLFDKQVQVRMGQANVKRWVDDLLPL